MENAPEYGETDNDTVARFYDNIISCSSDVPEAHKQYIQYQIHRHSRTCQIGNTHKCRFSFPIPPMSKTVILEPIDFESEAEENKFKAKWRKIHKHLNQYGLALEIKITYDELLVELEMSQEKYISAVRTSLVRPKLFLKCRPCEIRVNNYMKHCLEFWRANHDIQPSLSPYAMIQYMLSYVTKTQKGMSAIMDRACREARQGNMDIKASVRHMGNAFLNGVETSAQEAACLVLQLPITRMSREVVFLHTSPPDERTFLLKDFKTLQEMDPESEDIQSHNILVEYRKRPRCLEKYCLADFASEL